MDKKEMALYKQLKRDYVLEYLDQEIVAANAAGLQNKLLQLAQGAIYSEDGSVLNVHMRKKIALDQIIEEANGQPVLVFYWFKFDRDRLLEWYPEAEEINDKNISKWNEGKIPILLAHPASAGHGLNLQAGGHIIAWYGMNWSSEYYSQANARLDRQGQTESVVVHHIITKGTDDSRVLDVVQGKLSQQDALMAALKADV